MSKAYIYNVHSHISMQMLFLVDCVWDAWVNGTCSTTCGAGQQTNMRVKLTVEAYGGTCTENSTEVVSCLDVECPGMYFSMTFDLKTPRLRLTYTIKMYIHKNIYVQFSSASGLASSLRWQ